MSAPQPPEVTAAAWPEADALFRGDALWRGADDAYSVDLGGGRVLWLFADTFVAAAPGAPRAGGGFLRNSIGVMNGLDPSVAVVEFAWRTDPGGAPASFFPEDGATWFWPGDGERLSDGSVLIFLMQVESATGGFGFAVTGWRAVRIPDPSGDPLSWTLEWLVALDAPAGVIVGSASVLARDGFVFAYGAREPPPHDMFLARWAEADLTAASGSLPVPTFWCGEWSAAGAACAPEAVFGDGQTELSVHTDARTGLVIELQTRGFGATTIAWRAAATLEGPFSALVDVYRPPESDRGDAFVYAAKAHPELQGADLIATYASNGDGVFTDETLYYPRFVRLTYVQ